MAQDFVGSNNINVLLQWSVWNKNRGGADSASPRYIHTELNPIVDIIYPKDDLPLLTYTDDDGLLASQLIMSLLFQWFLLMGWLVLEPDLLIFHCMIHLRLLKILRK